MFACRFGKCVSNIVLDENSNSQPSPPVGPVLASTVVGGESVVGAVDKQIMIGTLLNVEQVIAYLRVQETY